MKIEKLILASASPRRKELIEKLGIPFEIMPSQVEEIIDERLSPEEMVKSLAEQKAEDVARKLPVDVNNAEKGKVLILGADTSVVLETNGKMEILGKPTDREDARSMFEKMSGQVHKVMTGVALYAPGGEKITSFVNVTEVLFYPLSSDEIECYLDKNEWTDKAGGYGIQGQGGLLVEKVNGCVYNVIGLPIAQLKRVLDGLQ